jgi:hypothetical protein
MLLSHCPNCQHDNKPGERFCAACGVPLDLKPCPVCGKVDSVKATVCSGCGAHFPPLGAEPAPPESAAPLVEPEKPIPPVVAPPPSTIRAFPLIVIALAAGGIPLLWLFRNTMPVPKAWQGPAQTIEVPATSLPPAKPEPVPAPATAAPAPALIPLPPRAAPPAVAVTPQAEAESPPEKPARAPVAKPKPKAPAHQPAAQAKPAASPAAPARPPAGTECTEALSAVGLCDPKAGKE